MEPFIALICMFGGNFAPRGWATCWGQIISIAQNTALFSLLGTTYGGNGQTTFALPDFRGRAPIGYGQGPGLPGYELGQIGGTPNITLTIAQMPMHTHVGVVTISVSNESGTTGTAAAGTNTLATFLDSVGGNEVYGYNNKTPNTALVPTTAGTVIQPAGGSQPFSIMQPYIAMNYIIALEGIYPSRN
ncbi:tail fiber protein [Chitinophaga pendula]|uniref:phage tail protein n=1 Tax=Chitinophaga TaxID=79328 RepID=UPI000BB08905|nr:MULTISPECIES: tail fiber protein [Chitinophaga]ASZ10371.1 phage tail protein [Chitinophaga sp. MD30]UCJ06664.1 tail fiber protein [Chitinophaga pendula]